MEYSDKTARSQMLPVQLATWDLARQLKEAESRAAEHVAEVISCCDNHKSDLTNKTARLVNDNRLARLRSRVSDEDMRHRLSLCRYLLVTNTDSTQFVRQVMLSISNFVWNLYPETVILWSEEDLESAKAEAEFGRRVTRAMLSPLGETPKELFELNEKLEVIAAQLCRATYQGQAMELMARVSSNQLELIDQQTRIIERFDEQDKKMERVNKFIRGFSIAAAVAAILSLVLQATALVVQILDIYSVIP